MQDGLKPGDFLVFQLESGFAMMRLLAEANGIWHVTVYGDFFPDVESAEAAAADPSSLSVNSRHLALTTRAFESTQTAAIRNQPLTDQELAPLNAWLEDEEPIVSDRSVRLMLGVR